MALQDFLIIMLPILLYSYVFSTYLLTEVGILIQGSITAAERAAEQSIAAEAAAGSRYLCRRASKAASVYLLR